MSFSALLLWTGLAGALAGSLAGFAGRSRRAVSASFLAGALGCALLAIQASWTLLGGGSPAFTLSLPGATSPSPLLLLAISEDPLSAFFLLVVSVSSGAVLVASVGYVDQFVHDRKGVLAGLCNLFILSMVLVCVAGTVFLFLVAWEAMTLLSYFLVIHEHEDPANRRAGLTYVIMSHAAAGGIIVALLLLAVGTGQPAWSGIAANASALSPWVRDTAFVAALVGFGTKAGMVPLHAWLPGAHPAAPSNVSALMSGVMIKMGILGLIRVVFDLLAGGPMWWAYAILALGAVSALVGVLYAIAQHDLKRLLAYHSIENIGIILMGMGASLAFLDLGYLPLAALALAATLLHTWNHALFKPLLFLGAGAAVGATGTKDIERLGGLIRRMPGVALGFLIGALAISALPPFNGFVSEWLLFHSFFAAFTTGSVLTEMIFSALAAVLALTSGLAAYCFVKAFGITFLARPRSREAETAPPVRRSLIGGMGFLASLCLLFGVAPVLALDMASPALTQLTGSTLGSGISWGVLSSLPGPSGAPLPLAPGVLALVLLAGLGVVWVAWRLRGPPRVTPRPSWDCGLDEPTSRMEYTASGYAQPLEQVFQDFYRPHPRTETRPAVRSDWASLSRLRAFSQEVIDPVWNTLYAPMAGGALLLARKASRLQSGRIHSYLAYMFVTLIVALLLVRFVWGFSP